MSDRPFLDTNILVYAYDRDEPEKQSKAASLVERALGGNSAVLSTQVLGEFFVTVTRQIRKPMTSIDAIAAIETISALPVIGIDLPLVRVAIGIHRKYQLSYWDGLIIAAAQRAGCARVLSEDMTDGQNYGGVTVENPFKRLRAE